MGRFEVTITKIPEEDCRHHSERLHVEVRDLESSSNARRSFANFADFNILEPRVRTLRVESLKNYQTILNQKVIPSASPHWQTENQLFNENTELFQKTRNEDKLITYSQGIRNSKSKSVWPNVMDSDDLDLRGDGSFIEINARELTTTERVSLKVIAERTISYQPKSILNDVLDDNLDEINQNQNETITPEGVPRIGVLEVDQPVSDANISSSDGLQSETEEITIPIGHKLKENPSRNSAVISRRNVSSHSFVIAVGNVLTIGIELEKSPIQEEIDALNQNVTESLSDEHLEKVLSNEAFLDPTDEVGIFGQKGPIIAGDFIQERTIEDEKKKLEQRAVQKELLKSLTIERLMAFGVKYGEANAIITAWAQGYTQHRPFSYRVTNTLKAGLDSEMPCLLKSQKFALEFLRHAEKLQEIIESATCTAIEAQFFLMLPHYNMQQKKLTDLQQPVRNYRTIETVNSRTLMKDWVQLVFAAAYQLKPDEPRKVARLIRKEIKLINKPLNDIRKVVRKIKDKGLDLQKKLEKIQQRLVRRIEPRPEWVNETVQKVTVPRATIEEAFEHLKIPENSASSNIFENSMHLAIGVGGVLIKQKMSDQWFSFSNLNFVERRVLFLGLTDHLYSSTDAILRTLRHLLELYTSGYPNNIKSRIVALNRILKNTHLPFLQLDPQSRMKLYLKMFTLANSIDRFENTVYQLAKMIGEVRKEIASIRYKTSGNAFLANIIKESSHIHLVVPFATLSVEGMSDLKLRGFEIEELTWTNPNETGLQIDHTSESGLKTKASLSTQTEERNHGIIGTAL